MHLQRFMVDIKCIKYYEYRVTQPTIADNDIKYDVTYSIVVQGHLELFKVQPPLGFLGIQIMEVIPGRETK